jgi:hypothetical protein
MAKSNHTYGYLSGLSTEELKTRQLALMSARLLILDREQSIVFCNFLDHLSQYRRVLEYVTRELTIINWLLA